MRTLERFATAERMEALAARIYRLLAEQHARDPKARDLFERLAGEEDQHVLRVRLAQRHYLRDRTSVEDISLDTESAQRVVRDAERLCEELASRQTTLPEARDLALRLEEDFAQAHADMLTRDSPPELRAFFQSLASQDRHHSRLLSEG